MIIINADDWGRSRVETDSALSCFKKGRITSVTAMVFMDDSARAADLAQAAGLEVGLHLNLSQHFTGGAPSALLREHHANLMRYLSRNKYALAIYNPVLTREFRYVYEAQVEEFIRLYKKPPSHIDGHHHRHLCANIVLGGIIPRGEKVRRNFTFWPGERGPMNRLYRNAVDQVLCRRYRLTNYFFALAACIQNNEMARVAGAAESATVELMSHPAKAGEYAYLMSDEHLAMLRKLRTGTYKCI
jgi:predicted glycoside hydrolase/deacetylase ChbG (UPF0249 family)